MDRTKLTHFQLQDYPAYFSMQATCVFLGGNNIFYYFLMMCTCNFKSVCVKMNTEVSKYVPIMSKCHGKGMPEEEIQTFPAVSSSNPLFYWSAKRGCH